MFASKKNRNNDIAPIVKNNNANIKLTLITHAIYFTPLDLLKLFNRVH